MLVIVSPTQHRMPVGIVLSLNQVDWSLVVAVCALGVSLWSVFYVRSQSESAKRSADAAEKSAAEAMLARLDRRAVVFTLEKTFTGVSMEWPRGSDPAPTSYAYGGAGGRQEPNFTLELHASAPVRDVVVEMTIGGDVSTEIPPEFAEVAKELGGSLRIDDADPDTPHLEFDRPSGGVGYALYRCWRETFPHISPAAPRTFTLPQAMLARFFLLGLQAWAQSRRGDFNHEREFTVTVSWSGPDDARQQDKFEFALVPFGSSVIGPGERIAYIHGAAHMIEKIARKPSDTPNS